MSTTPPPNAAAGWYDDGHGQRWWDGQAWTDIRPPSTDTADQPQTGDALPADARPAGWYDQDDGRQRYFDGADWTEAYQKPSATKPRWWRTNWGVIGILVVVGAALTVYASTVTDEASYEAGREWGREWGLVVVTASGDSHDSRSVNVVCASAYYRADERDDLDKDDWIDGCLAGYQDALRDGGY